MNCSLPLASGYVCLSLSLASCARARYAPCTATTPAAVPASLAPLRPHDIPTKIPQSHMLWIVNGRKASQRRISHLNPRRIATMTFIGAENARLCYGNRGRNGAIFLTTKRAGK
jgi:hypothetical protein